MTESHTKDSGNSFAIGGIKFSQELIQITVSKRDPLNASIEDLLQLIAEQSINIPFLCHSDVNEAPESVLCFDINDFGKIQTILKSSSFPESDIAITSSVGTLTLFPHKYSFYLLGRIIGLLGRYQFPIYSLSTSISAIAINTDYSSLDKIVEKLRTVVELPQNHAPFRQEFYLKQIPQ